jgi:hypothetical protein
VFVFCGSQDKERTGTKVAANTYSMMSKTNPAMRLIQSVFTLTLLPQSWRKHLDLICNERFQPYFVIAFTLWLVGTVELIQKTGGQGLDPRFWMLLAVMITLYCGLRIFRLFPQPPNLASPKVSTAVSEMVNRIQSSGLEVYHESTGQQHDGGFVVIGRAGIYAMEVKTRNVFGSRTIEFRKGNELVLGGRISDSRPLKEAQAAADKIWDRLQGIVATRSAVKPLVVFLDDWQVTPSQTEQNVAVVSANELQHYLDAQQPIFSESEVTEISNCLSN